LNYGSIQYSGELGNQLLDFSQWQSGYGLSLSHYISPSFNAGLQAGYNFLSVTGPDSMTFSMYGNIYTSIGYVEYKLANGYLLKEKSLIQPYIKAAGGLINGKTWGSSMDNAGEPYNMNIQTLGFLLSAGCKFKITDHINAFVDLGNYWIVDEGIDGARSNPAKDMFYTLNAGLIYSFGKVKDSDKDGVHDTKDKCPNTPIGCKVNAIGCPVDTDNDSIPDCLDDCPDQFGSIIGCPDKDGDNIPDFKDKCPEEFGTIGNKGCPEQLPNTENQQGITPNDDSKTSVNIYLVAPANNNSLPTIYSSSNRHGLAFDSDGDQIADNIDHCPDLKGTIENFGCPPSISFDSLTMLPVINYAGDKPAIIPGCPGDKDCDGIADEIDKCPEIAGDIKNKGCKASSSFAKWRSDIKVPAVHFATGSTYLTEYSRERLKKLIDLLTKDPNLNVWIFGHTDAKGSSEINIKISEKRATSVVDFLIANGIDSSRIFSMGFGETFPVAFGHTNEDQLLNRRIDFYIFEK